MATGTVTPATPAAAPAASTTSTPAAAPATPVAAPVAPAAAAPVAPATPEGGAPAAPATPFDVTKPLEMKPGETSAQFIQRKLELAKQATEAKPAEVVAPVVDPAKPAEPGKEPAKADAVTEDVEALIAAEDITLEETGLLDPGKFNETIQGSPELQKLLEAQPQLKNELFKTLRVAAQAGAVLKELPSLEAAKFAKQQTEFVAALRSDLTNTDDPAAMGRFFQRIDEESRLTDDKGEFLKDAQGNFQTDGSGERMVRHVMTQGLAALEANAKESGNEDLQAALKIIRDAVDAPSSQAKDGLTEAQLAQQATLDKRAEELQRQDRETRQAARKQTESQLSGKLRADLETNIDRIFGQIEITEFNKGNAKQQIMAGFVERIGKDPLYAAQRDYLAQQVQTPEVLKQRANLFHGALKQYLVDTARPILTAAGAQQLKTADAKSQKIATQQKESAAEPKGASAQPLPAAVTGSDSAELLPAFRKEFVSKHKRQPTSAEEVQYVMQQRMPALRARK